MEINHSSLKEYKTQTDIHPFRSDKKYFKNNHFLLKLLQNFKLHFFGRRLIGNFYAKYYLNIKEYVQWSEFQYVNYCILLNEKYENNKFSILEYGVWRGSVSISLTKLFRINYVYLLKNDEWKNVDTIDCSEEKVANWYMNPNKSAWYKYFENNMPFWVYEFGYFNKFDEFKMFKVFNDMEFDFLADVFIVNSYFYSSIKFVISKIIENGLMPRLILFPNYSEGVDHAMEPLRALYILKHINGNYYYEQK